MEQESNYKALQELSKSEFQIVGGEPNIIGWEVKSEHGAYIGKIKELLFEPETLAVRYMIIDLTDNGMHLDEKWVIIPIGLAHLHINHDEVVLPNIHLEQFNALPNYKLVQVGPEIEMQIRSIIGSPAALRIEETISEFDQNEFYNHHHFDRKDFDQHGRSSENLTNQEISGTASMSDRIAEEERIHSLISESKKAAAHPSTSSDDLKNPATRGI